MTSSLAFLGTLAALTSSAYAGFSATHYSLNYPNQLSNVDIVYANTTLVLPKVPSPAVDSLALWPGMSTVKGTDGTSDLVQSIAVAFGNPSQAPYDGCNGKTGQWCAFSYLYDPPNDPVQGKYVPVNAGDHLVIEYTQQGANYKQTISKSGKVISSLTHASGSAYSWYTAVECHEPFNAQAPTHEYLDTTIMLKNAEPKFGSTLSQGSTDATSLTTPDGGKTWKVSRITMKASQCKWNS